MTYNDELAPIVLFTYNRLEHTRKTVNALQQNDLAAESELYIVSDGYKNDNDKESVLNLRAYLKEISGFKKIHYIFRKKNYGLGRNIISGLNTLFSKYNSVIVIEDDIITAPDFLKYMNIALKKYEKNDRIMAVSGYTPPIESAGLQEYFYLPWFECWGWGTWKNCWEKYERNPRKLIKTTNLDTIYLININGTSPDMWDTVINNYLGRLYTWAIFLCVTIIKNNGLVIYSKNSLCKNIGFDGTGENCDDSNVYDVKLDNTCFDKNQFMKKIYLDKKTIKVVEEFNKNRLKKNKLLVCKLKIKTLVFWIIRGFI